jgi:HAE1 family hydrophobic/amphiphilic exporter-1
VVPLLGADLIPQLAQDRFEMTVKLPPGTPLRDTDSVVQELQRAHGKDPGMAALYGVSGTGTRLDASPTESGENIAKLTAVMENGGNEKLEAELTEKLRGGMAGHANAQLDFSRPNSSACPRRWKSNCRVPTCRRSKPPAASSRRCSARTRTTPT